MNKDTLAAANNLCVAMKATGYSFRLFPSQSINCKKHGGGQNKPKTYRRNKLMQS